LSTGLSFDEMVTRIEDIGELLRNDATLGIEERVTLYEEAVTLTRRCKTQLKDAYARKEDPLG
jgi:exodeoxyribonuclease VII small subunit